MFLSVNNSDTTGITFSEPENNEDILFCELLNGKEPLYVQTPKMMFEVNNQKSMTLLFQCLKDNSDEILNPFYEFLKTIESTLCSKISEYSKTWFSQEISQQTIKNDLYKTSIVLPQSLKDPLGMKISLPYNNQGQEEFEVYNKSQKRLDFSYLTKNPNIECTFLLLAKELVLTSTQAHVEWELVQVLTHKKKKKITGFGIRKDKNEHHPLLVKETTKKKPKEEIINEETETTNEEKPIEDKKQKLSIKEDDDSVKTERTEELEKAVVKVNLVN